MSASIALVLALAGCTAPNFSQIKPNAEATERADGVSLTEKKLVSDDVGAFPGYLECDGVNFLQDDLYSIGRMKGLDCSSPLGFVTLRVYESKPAMLNRLQDWGDLIDHRRAVIIGENWFAYGDIEIIEKLADRVGGIIPSESGLPSAPPISDDDGRRRSCGIVVVSAIRGMIFDDSVAGQGDVDYDDIFPGSDSIAADISKELNQDGRDFEYEITLHAEKIREFCAEV